MIKDIIRLKAQALSHEQIAIALKISKGVVSKYLALASSAGLDWEAAQALNELQLTARLLPRANTLGGFVEPDWANIHRELDRKGVTLVLLWQEYQAANAEHRTWGYTQFWAHYKAFVKSLKRSMRQHRLAGEKLFIDFAGPTVPLLDGSRAQIFVAAMAASSYVFACATSSQRLEDWIERIVRALAFYGGMPQCVRLKFSGNGQISVVQGVNRRVHDLKNSSSVHLLHMACASKHTSVWAGAVTHVNHHLEIA